MLAASSQRGPKFRYDDALESDLATPAREITSRHRADRRSLLPLAARRDAIARNATSRIAPRNRRSYSEEKPKPRSVAVSEINVGAACTLALIYEWQRGPSQQYSPLLWKLYMPAIGKFRPALRSIGTTVADFIEYRRLRFTARAMR
jgi:hypothetical protein